MKYSARPPPGAGPAASQPLQSTRTPVATTRPSWNAALSAPIEGAIQAARSALDCDIAPTYTAPATGSDPTMGSKGIPAAIGGAVVATGAKLRPPSMLRASEVRCR